MKLDSLRAGVAMVAVLGCSPKTATTSAPSLAAARPADLIGEFSPNGMERVIAFGKQTDPMLGAMLASAFPSDGTFPVAYFVLDSNKYAHPIVEVKPIKGGKPPTTPTEKLTTSPDGAYVLIGTEDAIKDVSAYAFAVLARHDGAAWPTATLYSAAVLSSYGKSLQEFELNDYRNPTGGTNPAAVFVVSNLLHVLGYSDHIDVKLDATTSAAALDLNIVPLRTEGSDDLAAFAAMQKPSDFSLAAKLPPYPARFAIAGHLELDARLRQSIGAMRTGLDACLANITGDFAAVYADEFNHVRASALVAAANWKPCGDVITALANPNLHATLADTLGAVEFSDDATEAQHDLDTLLDAAHGKGKPRDSSPFATPTQRHDSIAMLANFGVLDPTAIADAKPQLGPAALFSLGFTGGDIHLHIDMPAEQLYAFLHRPARMPSDAAK